MREAFAQNFAVHGEPGAAACVSVNGTVVVDLWGGWRDRARAEPWQHDTLVNFFSVSKALCALCVLRLVESGALDLDAPVARYWPEFAQAGKEAITTRQILSHRAALPAIAEPLADGAMLDWALMTEALARTPPWWEPGSALGYHVNTFGFLTGEIVRRIAGKTIGTMLREEIAEPLGADVHIGLPSSEHARAAEFLWPEVDTASTGMPSGDEAMRWKAYWNPSGFFRRRLGEHARLAPRRDSLDQWSRYGARRDARLRCPDERRHHRRRAGVVERHARRRDGGTCERLRSHQSAPEPLRFGLPAHPARTSARPNPGAFGHFGAGGSLGFCDPQTGVAFGYVTNDMGPRWQNPRNRGLIDAVFASLCANRGT